MKLGSTRYCISSACSQAGGSGGGCGVHNPRNAPSHNAHHSIASSRLLAPMKNSSRCGARISIAGEGRRAMQRVCARLVAGSLIFVMPGVRGVSIAGRPMYGVAGQQPALPKRNPGSAGVLRSQSLINQAAFFIVAMSITKR